MRSAFVATEIEDEPYYIGLTLDGPAAKERKEIEMTGRQVQIARRLLGWTPKKGSLKRPTSNSRTTINPEVRGLVRKAK